MKETPWENQSLGSIHKKEKSEEVNQENVNVMKVRSTEFQEGTKRPKMLNSVNWTHTIKIAKYLLGHH